MRPPARRRAPVVPDFHVFDRRAISMAPVKASMEVRSILTCSTWVYQDVSLCLGTVTGMSARL